MIIIHEYMHNWNDLVGVETKISVIHDYFGGIQTMENEFVDHDYSQEHNPDGMIFISII